MTAIMNEAQRQAYLEQCGVLLWYSRKALPGAGLSADLDFSDLQAGVGTDSRVEFEESPRKGSVRPQPEKPARSLLEQIAPIPGQGSGNSPGEEPGITGRPVLAKPIKRAVELVQPSGVTSASHSFSAQLRIAVTDDLVVIAQLGDDLPVEVQEKLLRQICDAIGQAVVPDNLTTLSWPVFANRRVPDSGDRGCAAMLEGILKPVDSRLWLQLGAEVAGLLSHIHRSESSGPRLVFDHDLGMIATSGRLKKKLWTVLGNAPLLMSAAPGS